MMKKTLTSLVLAGSVLAGDAAHVSFDLADFMTGDIKRRRVVLTPQSTPAVEGTTIITDDFIRFFSDGNGQFTASNTVAGIYQVEILGPQVTTTFNINVPDTNIVVDASTLITTSTIPADTVGYTINQADATFIGKTNDWGLGTTITNAPTITATNLTAYSSVFLMPGTGTSNFVFTLTNATTGQGEWRTAPGAGGGEANVNGEISVTNATRYGIVYGKSGITNLLRSIEQGANIVITNQGTNLVIASTASGGGGAQTGSYVLTNFVANVGMTNVHANHFAVSDGELYLINGAWITNFNGQGPGTNYGNWMPGTHITDDLGALADQWDQIWTRQVSVTNITVWDLLNMQLNTGNRVAVWSGTKNLTNAANIDPSELDFLDNADRNLIAAIDNLDASTNSLDGEIDGLQATAITNLWSHQFTNYGTATTNFLLSSAFIMNGNVFWDDFSRPDTTNTANGGVGFGASSPSGHPIIVDGPDLGTTDTNAFILNGRAKIEPVPNPTSGNPTFYYLMTNHQSMTRIGGRITSFDFAAGEAGQHGFTMAAKPIAGANTYMVHWLISTNEFNLQITTNGVANLYTIGLINWRYAWTNGQSETFEMDYLGNNTIMVSGMGTNMTVRHPQIDVCWRGPSDENVGAFFWEVGATSTNIRNRIEMDAIWGGHSRSYFPDYHGDHFGTRWNGAGSERFHSANLAIKAESLQTNNVFRNSANSTEIRLTNNATAGAMAIVWGDGGNEIWAHDNEGIDYRASTGDSHLFRVGSSTYIAIDSSGNIRPFTDLEVDSGIAIRRWKTNWNQSVDTTNAVIHGLLEHSLITGGNIAVWDANNYLTNGTLTLADLVSTNTFDTGWTNTFLRAADGGTPAGTDPILYYDEDTAQVKAADFSTFAGAASPGGADREIQYNNSTSLDGASGVMIPAGSETNLHVVGDINVYNLVVTNDLEIVGDGEGIIILKDADASHQYAFKVPATLNTRFTNVFDFGVNPVANDVLTIHGTNNGIITWTNLASAGSGEANVNGYDIGTNAAMMTWVIGKSGVTNRLRNVQATNGISLHWETEYITVSNSLGAIGSEIQAYDADLSSAAALASVGLVTRTAADTWTTRDIVESTTTLVLTDGDGVAGNPTFAVDGEVESLASLEASGLITRSADDTLINRTLAETGDAITIADGDGVAGNPTFSLATVLENTTGTGLLTNVAALSISNATMKPLFKSNAVNNGVASFFGLEEGANITLTVDETNIIIAASGGAASTNHITSSFGDITVTNGIELADTDIFPVSGEGGPNTNYIIQLSEQTIGLGWTNTVNISNIVAAATGMKEYYTVLMTNLSGSDQTLGFVGPTITWLTETPTQLADTDSAILAFLVTDSDIYASYRDTSGAITTNFVVASVGNMTVTNNLEFEDTDIFPVSGEGTLNTNYTIDLGQQTIGLGFTNVINISNITAAPTGMKLYRTVTLTNLSGSDRTIGFVGPTITWLTDTPTTLADTESALLSFQVTDADIYASWIDSSAGDSIASKQTGSFILTNFVALGMTNIGANQFEIANGTLLVKSNATFTNITWYGSMTNQGTYNDPSVTPSTVATWGAAGNLGNSAVTTTELGILGSGVTIAELAGGSSADLAGELTDEIGTGRAVFSVDADLTGTTEANQIAVTNEIIFLSSASSVYLDAATSDVTVTNLLGVEHELAAAVIEIDANVSHDWVITNRISAATTLVITNTSDGQDISIRVIGEASGGTDRVLTLVPELGHLVADEDDYATALALNNAITLTNGNAIEISWAVRKMNGTNVAGKISRQFKF